jgi:hypothetical protein
MFGQRTRSAACAAQPLLPIIQMPNGVIPWREFIAVLSLFKVSLINW